MKLSTQEIEQQYLDADALAAAVSHSAGSLEETMDRAWCNAIQSGRAATGGDRGPAIGAGVADFPLQ